MIRKLLKKLRKKALQPQYFPTLAMNEVNPTAELVTFTSAGATEVKVKDDTRIEKKPVEIVAELVSSVPLLDLTNLDSKIKLVEKRLKCFKRVCCSGIDEEIALLYLKARKEFIKHQDKFHWQVTTDDLIKQLCEKYKVQKVSLSGYYKSLPMEAVVELEKFCDGWELVCDRQPLFELIIDKGGKEYKKDPILLAKSPFGNWYYILGAWDKEVEIVDKLVYENK